MSSIPASSSSSPTSPQPSHVPGFKRWLRDVGLMTGLAGTADEIEAYQLKAAIRTCEERKARLLQTSPMLIFLRKHLQLTGCALPASNIQCISCDATATHAGSFLPTHGAIKVCAQNIVSEGHMENTLAHEMMHMYDQCKFDVDWGNLWHHACSEIRAGSLSGDCRFFREVDRRYLSFTKHHQDCVRRRAIASVAANENCPDQATAERVVNEVWESCFNDTRPFDEIY